MMLTRAHDGREARLRYGTRGWSVETYLPYRIERFGDLTTAEDWLTANGFDYVADSGGGPHLPNPPRAVSGSSLIPQQGGQS